MKTTVATRITSKLWKISGWGSRNVLHDLNVKYETFYHVSCNCKNNTANMKEKLTVDFVMKQETLKSTFYFGSMVVVDDLVDKAIEILMHRAKNLCKKELKGKRGVTFDFSSDYQAAKPYWLVKNQDCPISIWNPPFPESPSKRWNSPRSTNAYISGGVLFTMNVYYPDEEAFNLLKTMGKHTL